MIELFKLIKVVDTRTAIVMKSRKKIPLHQFLSVRPLSTTTYHKLPTLLNNGKRVTYLLLISQILLLPITFFSCHLPLV